MKDILALSFAEYIRQQGDLFLEMADHANKPRTMISLDQDDIDFLEQIDRRFWKQALRVRYGKLLIKALQEREARRQPQYDAFLQQIYNGKIKEYKGQPVEGYDDFYKKAYNKSFNANQAMIVARKNATFNAKYWAKKMVDDMPLYSNISPQYNRPLLTFQDKKNLRTYHPYTDMNALVKKLETNVGHPYSDNTIVGKVAEEIKSFIGRHGYDLWGAQPEQDEIPPHTDGMNLYASDKALQDVINGTMERHGWLDGMVDEALGKTDHEQLAQDPRYQYIQDLSGSHYHGVEKRVITPLAQHFCSMLDGKGSIAFCQTNNSPDHQDIKTAFELYKWPVPQGIEFGGSKNIDQRMNFALKLARVFVWWKAKQSHPDTVTPKSQWVGEGTHRKEINGTIVQYYHMPDPTDPTNKDKGHKFHIWRSDDGEHVEVINPKLQWWHKSVNIPEVQRLDDNKGDIAMDDNGNVKYKQRSADKNIVPHMLPGGPRLFLPHWLWKQDSDLQNYHSNIDARYSQQHKPLTAEWYFRSIMEDEAAKEPNGVTNPEKVFTDKDAAANINSTRGIVHEDDLKTGTFPLGLDYVRRDPPNADNITIYDKNKQPLLKIPTFGRLGEYIKPESKEDMAILFLQKQFEPSEIDRIKNNALQAWQASLSGRKPHGQHTLPEALEQDEFYKELGKKRGAAAVDKAKQNVGYLNDFMRSMNKEQGIGQLMPNQRTPAQSTIPQDSNEWERRWKIVEDIMGKYEGMVNPKDKAVKFDTPDPYKPIYNGVAWGLTAATRSFPEKVSMALKGMGNDLYNIALNWVFKNLGNTDMFDPKGQPLSPAAINKLIATKACNIVIGIGQLDIAGVGGRRTHGLHNIMSGSNGITNAEGNEGATPLDNLSNEDKAKMHARSFISNRNHVGKAAIMLGTKGFAQGVDTYHQLILDNKKKLEAREDLSKIIDDSKLLDEFMKQLDINTQLYESIREHTKYTLAAEATKKGEQPPTPEQITAAAKAEFDKHLISIGKGPDAMSQLLAKQADEKVSAVDEQDRKTWGDKYDRDSALYQWTKDLFKDWPTFSNEILSKPSLIGHYQDLYNNDQDGAVALVKLYTKGTPDGNKIYNKMMELFKKGADEDMMPAKEAIDQNEKLLKRGQYVGIHTVDEMRKNLDVDKMLINPLANQQTLESPNLIQAINSQDYIQMIDKRIHTPVVTSKNPAQDMQFLRSLRNKVARVAAGGIDALMKSDTEGVLADTATTVSEIRTFIKKPQVHWTQLTQPEILARKEMIELIDDRISQLKVDIEDHKSDTGQGVKGIRLCLQDINKLEELRKLAVVASLNRIDPSHIKPTKVMAIPADKPTAQEPPPAKGQSAPPQVQGIAVPPTQTPVAPPLSKPQEEPVNPNEQWHNMLQNPTQNAAAIQQRMQSLRGQSNHIHSRMFHRTMINHHDNGDQPKYQAMNNIWNNVGL